MFQTLPNKWICHSPIRSCIIYSTKDMYKNSPIELRKNVSLKHLNDFFTDIKKLTKVLFEPNPPLLFLIKNSCSRHKTERVSNPISLLNAIKNPTELKGSIRSHEKDGVALVRFIRWFKSAKINQLDEISLVTKLEKVRKIEPSFYYNSFDTISARVKWSYYSLQSVAKK